ncbi:MAG: YeeE/YedE family protein [Gammaproteobacteria bacterium]|nr:YeeE/YedE family protein [Gammaproteobacteria bacterium]
MEFESFSQAESILLWSAFAVAVVMGAIVNKTNFCTMGAVSDVVNMGDYGRMRAWLLAMGVAMLGVTLLEFNGMISADDSFPPYRGSSLTWGENIIGGILFGIGMTLASGCGNKTLIRIGGGNIKSIVVFLVIAVIAYFMVNPFPGSDKTLFSELFFGWTRGQSGGSPLTISLNTKQDLGSLLASGEGVATARFVIGSALSLLIMYFVFKSADFRASLDNILGGLVVGLCIIAVWWVSSNVKVNLDDEIYSLRSVAQQWDFLVEDSSQVKPADTRPLSPQSYTFINPMGQTVGLAANGFSGKYMTFGIMAVLGVIFGSFLWAIFSKGFRIEWFANKKDFVNHFIGAILMGFGGVLALGCTIGQGVTGVSTLALGSFFSFVSIVFGSAITMKTQFYMMVYEEEASFAKAVITSLVDFKLLPSAMRKLDPV